MRFKMPLSLTVVRESHAIGAYNHARAQRFTTAQDVC